MARGTRVRTASPPPARWAIPPRYAESRRRYYASDLTGPRDGPGPAPTSPMRAAEVLAEFSGRLSGGLKERPASAPVRLFHAASPTDVDHGRAARPGREPGCRRLARRSVRRLRRGGGRPLAVRSRRLWPTSFGLLESGGVMANFMAIAIARICISARARAAGTAAWQGPRRRAGLHERPGRISRSRVRSMSSGSRRTRWWFSIGMTTSTYAVPQSRTRWRKTAPRPDPVRHRCRRRLDEHGLGRRGRRAADVAEAEDLWPTSTRRSGGGARLSARDRDRVPDLDRADSVTVDPHKWFFQAYDIGGLLVRDGRMLSAVFGGRAWSHWGGESAERVAGLPARRRARRLS